MIYLQSLLADIGEHDRDYDGIEKMVYNFESLTTAKLLQLKWLCDIDAVIGPTDEIKKVQELLVRCIKERIK